MMKANDDEWLKNYVRNTRGRMFKSDFFEFFSKVHPATPFVFWIPLATAILGYGLYNGITRWQVTVPMLVVGFFSWQFLEYFIHRDVFHLFPGPTAHGFHHKYPDDDTRLVMPLTVSIGLATLIGGGLYLVGQHQFTLPYWAGLVYGYLWYDFMHWSTHHRKPLTAWGKKLRDHHMAHHFADPHKNFGLSHMWMDRLLGTDNKREKK